MKDGARSGKNAYKIISGHLKNNESIEEITDAVCAMPVENVTQLNIKTDHTEKTHDETTREERRRGKKFVIKERERERVDREV